MRPRPSSRRRWRASCAGASRIRACCGPSHATPRGGKAMSMFSKALAALARATCSRREVLKGTGALIVGVSATHMTASLGVAQGPFATRASHVDPQRLDAWLAIAADGTVTASTGKCEFGQGILTAQTQLVAEELAVPIARVRLIECDTALCPDQGTTSGSQWAVSRRRAISIPVTWHR